MFLGGYLGWGAVFEIVFSFSVRHSVGFRV